MEGILEIFFWSGSSALSPFLYVVIFLETAMAQRLRACIFFVNARHLTAGNHLISSGFSLLSRTFFAALWFRGIKRAKNKISYLQLAAPSLNNIWSMTSPIRLMSPSIRWPYTFNVVDTSL